MKRWFVFALVFLTLSANAQQNYDVSLISKDLLAYACAVIRNQDTKVAIKDIDNTTYHFEQAITILNKNGDDNALIILPHNKMISIKNIKGMIYNSAGVAIGKFNQGNFTDSYAEDGFSLYNDESVLHYQPSVTDYPYTIYYQYDMREKQTLGFEDWEPNSEKGVAIEHSQYVVTVKKGFNIRYKEINLPAHATITTNENQETTYSWNLSDLKAVRDEPYSPDAGKYLSMVKIAPESFEYDGYTGSFKNWNELGKWMYDKLLINRGQLPASTIENIKQLTAGITDQKLKAKKIYEYMQNKTRYVSIQVGIGGLQPFPASDVDRLNYGDCKALVNYTQALLKAVDIDSYYCEVMAGANNKMGLINDFASVDQTNHIILCLPFKNDTTWCDCTSQTIPFGYLGDFTDNRTVLACTPTGGEILHTPKYTVQDNLQERHANFVLNEDGEINGDMATSFHGVNYVDRDELITQSNTERLKSIQNYYPVNNMEIAKLDLKQDKGLQPVTTESIRLKAPEYASTDNGRINFYVNATNRMFRAPKDVLNRRSEVNIKEGYTEVDDIDYDLPKGFRPNTRPLNISIKEPFGNFTATTIVKDNKLVYERKLVVIDGTYSKDMYTELVNFFRDVVDADSYNMTLIKN